MNKKSSKSNFEIPEIYSQIVFPTSIEESVVKQNVESIFTIYPLKKGFSTTFANSLRRALLSSIHGTAITGLKISGISHQFSAIQGIKEDVTTIISALKEIIISPLVPLSQARKISFSVSKKGIFTAKDIPFGSDFQILNPEKPLFEVVDSVKLDFEIFITSGFGYSKQIKTSKSDDINLMLIDAYYSPILNVSSTIEEKIVDEYSESHEKLSISIKTNGTIKPIEALKISSFLARQHFKFVIDFDEVELFQKEEVKMDINPYLIKKVTELELSVRASNCLRNENIMYVGELIKYSEADLIKTPNFGKKSLDEIKEVLDSIGLSLGTEIDNWDEIRKNYIDNN